MTFCCLAALLLKPLTVIKHLVSSPLDDEDTSYYTALAKQLHFYSELLFISVKINSYIPTEQKADHKPPPIEYTLPIRNTSETFSSVFNNRTLRDITHLLYQYKRNSSDSLITSLTHIIHCYDRTRKILPY